MVTAQRIHRRVVSCERRGASGRPPHPAPSADGLKKTPVRPTLSTKGERAGI